MAQIAIRINYDAYLLLSPGLLDKLVQCQVVGSVGYGDTLQLYHLDTSKALEVTILETAEDGNSIWGTKEEARAANAAAEKVKEERDAA